MYSYRYILRITKIEYQWYATQTLGKNRKKAAYITSKKSSPK